WPSTSTSSPPTCPAGASSTRWPGRSTTTRRRCSTSWTPSTSRRRRSSATPWAAGRRCASATSALRALPAPDLARPGLTAAPDQPVRPLAPDRARGRVHRPGAAFLEVLDVPVREGPAPLPVTLQRHGGEGHEARDGEGRAQDVDQLDGRDLRGEEVTPVVPVVGEDVQGGALGRRQLTGADAAGEDDLPAGAHALLRRVRVEAPARAGPTPPTARPFRRTLGPWSLLMPA